jgi:hypothetical protein
MGAPRAGLSARHRLARGSWVSLFAMLMIFIGPLISQAMPMDQHAGMSMDMLMSADMDMHHASAEQQDDASKADHVLWAKCGYCTLLFSCPALPYMAVLVADAPPRPADFFTAQPRLGHAQRAIFPNARSRAPPARRTA